MASLHDKSYKLMFGFPLLVESLLCEFGILMRIPVAILASLDYRTLRSASSSYMTKDLQERLGDKLWSIQYAVQLNGVTVWKTLFVMLEFQSTVDRDMQWRISEYVYLLRQALRDSGEFAPGDELPMILPIVIYNGSPRWRHELGVVAGTMTIDEALRTQLFFLLDMQRVNFDNPAPRGLMTGLVLLEQANTPRRASRAMEVIFSELKGSSMQSLRWAFFQRARVMGFMKDGNGRELSFVELEEMLIGGNMSEVVETSFSRRMDALYAEGVEWGVKRGIKRGIEQGRKEMLEHERQRLCRQAAKRFDAETAERLAAAIAAIDDLQRLGDIGDWVVDSRTADELIARAGEPTA